MQALFEGRTFRQGPPRDVRKQRGTIKAVVARIRKCTCPRGLAIIHTPWAQVANSPPGEAVARARQAAQQALALDGTRPKRHPAGECRVPYGLDFASTILGFGDNDRSRRADTWHWFFTVMAMGRFGTLDEQESIELEPFEFPLAEHLGWCYSLKRTMTVRRATPGVLELDPLRADKIRLAGIVQVECTRGIEGTPESGTARGSRAARALAQA